MGILKKISRGIEKAERGYQQAKKDTAGARRVGMKVVDYIIPPSKKSKSKSPGKRGSSKTKTVKIGGCTCKCPKK